MTKLLCLILLSSTLVIAEDHPNFSGTWQLDSSKSQGSTSGAVALSIHQDNDQITLVSDEGGKSVTIKCSTNGQNCKMEGGAGEVSMYFNGAMLVELDMEGHNGERVTKKRLQMGDDGKTLEIEVLRITPPGPSEKLVFAKK